MFTTSKQTWISNPVIFEHVRIEGEVLSVLNLALRNEGLWRNWVKTRRILNTAQDDDKYSSI
jgi:hypothetical protein